MKKKMYRIAASMILAAGVVLSPMHASAGEKSMITQGASGHALNIGSVSKIYAVTAVMQLKEQGKIDLDAPLTKYIPEFRMADERYRDITVRMLMNHTSGLMGSIYGGCFLFDEKSPKYHDEFLTLLSARRLKYTPGEYNCYCNDGFTLLEILAERVSGLSFSDYLDRYISKPLMAEHTGTIWSMPDMDAQVPCYINGSIRVKPECTQILGAGGILSDAEELCTFGSAFFTGNHALLSEESKKEMAENYAAGGSEEPFGLGWDEVHSRDYDRKGVTVLKKGGDTNFQHANLTVAPEEEISIAVLSSGGTSSADEDLARCLLDIALEEKGISVEHPEEETPVLSNRIPEEYRSYEGLYANANMILEIRFPDMQYMLIRSLTNAEEFTQQYGYTTEGDFVKMSGDVESGNAIPQKPLERLDFASKGGSVYVRESGSSYVLEKVSGNAVNAPVLSAWEERNGVSYYYYNGSAGDVYYCLTNHCVTLSTNKEAKGYVNGCTMIDETHAESRVSIPGSASRDVSDLVVRKEGGREILTMPDYHTEYISEKDIPEFSDSITEVPTRTGAAAWYKINGLKNETLRFSIPEHAAVYVYDQYGTITYSSFMSEYNTGVPLPEYGMIVFVGDTGLSIGVSR